MSSQNCVPESNPAENVIPHRARDIIQALRDARDRAADLLPTLKGELIGVIDTREQVQGLEMIGSAYSYAFAIRDYADLLLWDMGEDDACRDAIGWKVAQEAVLGRQPLDYDRLDVLIEQERFEALRRLRQAGAGIAAETTVNAINAACDAARDCALGCVALRQLVEKQTPSIGKDAMRVPVASESGANLDVTEQCPQDIGQHDAEQPHSATTSSEFRELAEWADRELKGIQQRTITLLVEHGGRISLKNLASDPEINWQFPIDQKFNSLCKALNGAGKHQRKPKLRKVGWRIFRQNNEARLERIDIGQK